MLEAQLSAGYAPVNQATGQNDVLQGTGGGDVLLGGGRNGLIPIRSGDDALDEAAGDDVIHDFRDIDQIAHHTTRGVTTVSRAIAKARRAGSDVIFDFGQDDVLTVKDVTLGGLRHDLVFL